MRTISQCMSGVCEAKQTLSFIASKWQMPYPSLNARSSRPRRWPSCFISSHRWGRNIFASGPHTSGSDCIAFTGITNSVPFGRKSCSSFVPGIGSERGRRISWAVWIARVKIERCRAYGKLGRHTSWWFSRIAGCNLKVSFKTASRRGQRLFTESIEWSSKEENSSLRASWSWLSEASS